MDDIYSIVILQMTSETKLCEFHLFMNIFTPTVSKPPPPPIYAFVKNINK